ncbi:MAG: ABC transporter permease [Propionibacteriaceae bacterium]|jgi:putative ABC transport system permease protein|nr:ABC transporter permease [Propionibacteriaceae bacterium]
MSKTSPTRRRRVHLSLRDTLFTATLGPRGRPLRAVLSALGIAIGIAALVAMLGIPASFQQESQREFEAWGANMLLASPATDRQSGAVTPLPESAPAMIARIWSVKSSVALHQLDNVMVYRSDLVPAQESKGITAVVADGDPVATLSTSMTSGKWFDEVSGEFPTVVLGQTAALYLGAELGQRIWIGGAWWAVVGVIGPMPGFAAQYDAAAFLAPGGAERLWPDQAISTILVNAQPGKVGAVRSVLASTANPANPSGVEVTAPTQYGNMQNYVLDMFAQLALALGGIALLVGGIGIANTMVVSVMERRGEIGLRRALGARTGQVGLQFVLEAAVIGLFGGLIGVALGAYAVFFFTAYLGMAFAVPVWVLIGGPVIAVIIGALAGLYPSIKAARQSPTVTLRAT